MKVTKKVYIDIKRTIRTLNEEGRVPTHKERKRSSKRKDMYTELGKWHGVSYDTVHAIGLSRSYNDYHRICQKNKPAKRQVFTEVQLPLAEPRPAKLKEVTKPAEVVMVSMQDFIQLQEEVSILQSELAIIKAKKERWFRNDKTITKK